MSSDEPDLARTQRAERFDRRAKVILRDLGDIRRVWKRKRSTRAGIAVVSRDDVGVEVRQLVAEREEVHLYRLEVPPKHRSGAITSRQ